ncbi:uncharacterized protein LOC123290771 isoform X2 [Chrysoperla carnea]|uniref:uncharacterized protein LOC123290771 isoform X2 n=1 Tax=Chrysoperla carnea TaxID=189513 RepID=UPI001D0703B3|nr:uncharacterized protein LOC123290771 isoform X2 [Chrysoperla carnea]
MKFLICLTLVICGACGVLSAPDSIQDTLNELVAAVSSTAAPSTAASSTAASDPIQDALNGLNQYEDASKDLNDLIAAASSTAAPSTAASSTAAPSTAASSTAAPDPIQDALNGLTQLGKDLVKNIMDATNGLWQSMAVNGSNSLIGSEAGSGLLTPILYLISSTVQIVINGFSKPIFDAINNLVRSVTKNVTDKVTKISNLTSCANINNSTLNIEEPIQNLLECAKNSLDQAIQPVNQGVQIINQIGKAVSEDIANALKCASTPIFIFPNVLCFANSGLQTVLHVFSTAGSIFSLGATIVNNVLTIIPNNIQCTNTQINNLAQSIFKAGGNVGQCLS